MMKAFQIIACLSFGILLNCCIGNEQKVPEDRTELKSQNYGPAENRVKTLNKHVTQFSEVVDCQFDLFNVNGFGKQRELLPGASSWDYKFVVEVNPSDTELWVAHLTKTDRVTIIDSVSWVRELNELMEKPLSSKQPIQHYEDPVENQPMKGNNAFIAIDKGIIFRSIVNK